MSRPTGFSSHHPIHPTASASGTWNGADSAWVVALIVAARFGRENLAGRPRYPYRAVDEGQVAAISAG